MLMHAYASYIWTNILLVEDIYGRSEAMMAPAKAGRRARRMAGMADVYRSIYIYIHLLLLTCGICCTYI